VTLTLSKQRNGLLIHKRGDVRLYSGHISATPVPTTVSH